jgi:hypothetical protein
MSEPALCHCGHPVKGHEGHGCQSRTPVTRAGWFIGLVRCPCRCTPAEAAEPGRVDCPAHLPAEPGA